MFVYFLLAWGRKGGREGAPNKNNPTWVRCVDAAMAISHCTLRGMRVVVKLVKIDRCMGVCIHKVGDQS